MAGVMLAAAGAPLRIPLWVDLTAVLAGGVTGAATAQRRGFDIGGALVLAVVMGLGGGIIRDILIGHGPPAALQDNRPRGALLGDYRLKPSRRGLDDVFELAGLGEHVLLLACLGTDATRKLVDERD